MAQHAKKGQRVPDNQRELLLVFMEQHPQLATRASEFTPDFTAAERHCLWLELADGLNREGPVTKSLDQWQDWWRKQVYDARQDAAAVAEVQQRVNTNRATDACSSPAGSYASGCSTAPPRQRRPVRPPRQRRPLRVDVLTGILAQCAESLLQGTDLLRVAEAMRSSMERLAIAAERNTALLRRTAEAAERAADAREAILAELRGRASLQGPARREME
ncbi:hypothetical protein HPB52_021312 [Rhipicephalus sanguineus]|uniref:Regulatory protein zeste n=1 Tax=Rhipicephalus sanguineus TaxID=34632 RepID=A0A9D4SP52_RHISA|nr:hypothetical protein HPB52_021312 [Rhipicephalus sanguineus]